MDAVRESIEAAGLSDAATAGHDALLPRVCVAVVELMWSQPEYARRLAVETFRMGRATADAVARLADQQHLAYASLAVARVGESDAATDAGLAALPPLPALRELAIDHRPPYPPAGLERWPDIAVLEVFGVPAADDLRALPALEHLVAHQPESSARLEELRQQLRSVRITT